MYSVEFAYNIVPSDEAGQGLSNLLIRQLAAIESGKGLQQAARSLGVSYRYCELRRSNGEDADRAQRCFCRSLQP